MKTKLFTLASLVLAAGIFSFMPAPRPQYADLAVNLEKSRIDWVGSKKSDFHTGVLPLKSGSVAVTGGKLTGGKFVIDMAGLKVTDAAGDRLAGHLKSAEILDAAKYPEAVFEITSVNYSSENAATIGGNLSFHGATLPVSFSANIRNSDDKGFFAQAFFSFDRTLFGVKYGVGAISNDVQLAIHLFAK
ncbi:MAG: YceI family protein [Bacteroidota bacterium]|jgi:polyisoprenoid-binding protein YceI